VSEDDRRRQREKECGVYCPLCFLPLRTSWTPRGYPTVAKLPFTTFECGTLYWGNNLRQQSEACKTIAELRKELEEWEDLII
jgi:hypothetical protein